MNRKVLIILIISILSITLISGIIIVAVSRPDKHSDAKVSDSSENTGDDDNTYITPSLNNIGQVTLTPEQQEEVDIEVANFKPASIMDVIPSSLTVLVNKEYCLPKNYKPDNLVRPNIHFSVSTNDEKTLMRSDAAEAIEELFIAAQADGYELTGISAYRSYYRQYKIFTNNIATEGKTHTLMYSAVPGTSEHQTGLSIDVSTKSINNALVAAFETTPEGQWLAKNAHCFGFIIRYPKGKTDITGYAYEPWHIRYVGRGLAYYLYNHNLTLDQYYHYTPDPNFDFEALYADIINYVPPTIPPTISPTLIPTPTVMLDENGNIIAGNNTTTVTPAPPSHEPSQPPSASAVPTPPTNQVNGGNNPSSITGSAENNTENN